MPSLPGFIGPTYQGRNISVDGERCLNLIPELIESGNGADGARFNYYGRPGKTLFCTLGASPVRALWAGNNRLFAVGGNTLYECTSGSAVSLGTLGSYMGPGRAQIVGGPFGTSAALLVYDGNPAPSNGDSNVYWVTGVSPPAGVISGVAISYMDGYFICVRPGGDRSSDTVPVNTQDQTQFNLSVPLDGSSWDALQYGIRTAAPDAIQNILAPGSPGGGYEELFLLGKKTIEVWQNTGGQGLGAFPFQGAKQVFINEGLYAKDSVQAFDGSIFFLGGSDRGQGTVFRLDGYTPNRISTHAIEYAIQQLTAAGSDISTAVAYTMEIEGHKLYVLCFASKTFVYDATEKLWHEWASGSTYGALTADAGDFHAWTLGKHFIGDGSNGNIYVASMDVQQDNGNAIFWGRTATNLNIDHKWQTLAQFELLFGGPFTSTRNYTLEVSYDGGFNFGSPRAYAIPAASVSAGPRYQRAVWRRFGRFRDLSLRVSSTDNLQQSWISAIVDGQPGTGA